MKKSILLCCLCAALNVAALTANAQDNEPECNFGPENKCLPGLTDDQNKKIKEIKDGEMEKSFKIDLQIDEKEATLNTLRAQENVDMNAINSTVDEIGKLRTEQRKIHESGIQDIRKILTKEQRMRFDMQNNHHQGKKWGDCGNRSKEFDCCKGNRPNCNQNGPKPEQYGPNCPKQEQNKNKDKK